MFYGTLDRFGRPESPYPPGQALALLPWYAAGQFAAQHLPGVARRCARRRQRFVPDGRERIVSPPSPPRSRSHIFLQLGIAPKISLISAATFWRWPRRWPRIPAGSFPNRSRRRCSLGAAAVLFAESPETPVHVAGARSPQEFCWARPYGCGQRTSSSCPCFSQRCSFATGKGQWSAATRAGCGRRRMPPLCCCGGTHIFTAALFDFGYPAAAEGGKALNTFETPLATGPSRISALAREIHFSVFAADSAGHARLAAPVAPRSRAWPLSLPATPVVYLLFFATYTQWEGGYSYGPRYLVPALALLGLGIGPALERASAQRAPVWRSACFSPDFSCKLSGIGHQFSRSRRGRRLLRRAVQLPHEFFAHPHAHPSAAALRRHRNPRRLAAASTSGGCFSRRREFLRVRCCALWRECCLLELRFPAWWLRCAYPKRHA